MSVVGSLAIPAMAGFILWMGVAAGRTRTGAVSPVRWSDDATFTWSPRKRWTR